MNVQLIFEALAGDQQNSAHGIICAEMERQGYRVVMNGQPVTSDEFFDDKRLELEKELSVNIALLKRGKVEQQFSVEFEDFHEIAIRMKKNS